MLCLYNSTDKPKARNVGDHSPKLAWTNDRVALRCEAEGWPRPHIYWLKDNKNISSYEKEGYYIENIPTRGSKVKSIASELTIVAAQPDNSGEFTCVAVNEIGVSKYNITVVVSGKKIIYLFTYSFTYLFLLRLVCLSVDSKRSAVRMLQTCSLKAGKN